MNWTQRPSEHRRDVCVQFTLFRRLAQQTFVAAARPGRTLTLGVRACNQSGRHFNRNEAGTCIASPYRSNRGDVEPTLQPNLAGQHPIRFRDTPLWATSHNHAAHVGLHWLSRVPSRDAVPCRHAAYVFCTRDGFEGVPPISAINPFRNY